jgi:hypothetical protein
MPTFLSKISGLFNGGQQGGGLSKLGSLLSGATNYSSSPVTSNWTQASFNRLSPSASGGNQYAYTQTGNLNGSPQGTYFVPANPNVPNGPGKTFNYGGVGSYAGTSDNRWGG